MLLLFTPTFNLVTISQFDLDIGENKMVNA